VVVTDGLLLAWLILLGAVGLGGALGGLPGARGGAGGVRGALCLKPLPCVCCGPPI